MWGRPGAACVFGVELALALGVLASCGGRSSRHIADEGAHASGGTGGTASAAGGAAGRSAGASGTGEVLRPCKISTVGAEVFPPLVLLLDGSSYGRLRLDAVKAGVLSLVSNLRDGSRLGVAVARETGDPAVCGDDPALVLDAAPLDAGRRRTIEATLARADPGGTWVHLFTYAAVVDGLDALGDNLTTANIVVVGGGLLGGEPVCGAPSDASAYPLSQLMNLAEEAVARGIMTSGLGIDGSYEELNLLVLLSYHGGVPCSLLEPERCFEDLSGEPDLGAALANAFRDRALRDPASCTFPLQAIPSERRLDPDVLTFTLTRGGVTAVVERTAGPCTSGWLLSEDGNNVVLCPDTCEAFRGDPSSHLEVGMACDGPPPRD